MPNINREKIDWGKQTNKQTDKQNLRNLLDYHKRSNIFVIRVLEGEERDGRPKKIFEEIMAKNYVVVIRDMNLNSRNNWTLHRRKTWKSTQGYIIIKMKTEDKENILKAVRKKKKRSCISKGKTIQMVAHGGDLYWHMQGRFSFYSEMTPRHLFQRNKD